MSRITIFLLAALCVLLGPLPSAHAQAYVVTNLVSDGSVTATTMDPGFLNPWGISVSGTWWISTANTGYSYVVPATTDAIAFKVVIPAASGTGTGAPAGSATTAGATGMVLSNGTKASFLFSTLDGAVYGWNSKLGTSGAVTLSAINSSSAAASYPGLAILNPNATSSYILLPNFGAGNKVEVYDSTFKPTTLSGSFTDPNLPSGYSPWSIQILNNQVWVAYALRGSSAPYAPTLGAGNGIVDVFDTSGNFVARAVTGGNLNAPWGIAFAPATGFGIFSGDLLIGNFGDGHINVYDPKNSYAYLGQLVDSTGKPLVYASLWSLLTGGTPILNSTSVSGGSLTSVYLTAGLANQQHGLLAAINSSTVSGASPTFAFSSSASSATVTDGNTATFTLAAVPVNGYSGTMTFTCSGLPVNSVCIFSPYTLSVASNAPASTTLSITTMGSKASMGFIHYHHGMPPFALASIVPLSLLPLAMFVRRRRSSSRALRLFGPLAILVLGYAATVLVLGCGNSASPATTPPSTPTGNSIVTVTATPSGGAPQQTSIALTVQ
ncbi:MAG TPA: TIGR03118 family protein [Acidobacteriaceae bacterium]|nr:TIGR03118 family protein [Acidobacteriaceae bacterium]